MHLWKRNKRYSEPWKYIPKSVTERFMRYQKEISKQAGFSKFLKGLERKPEGTRDDGIGFLPVLVPLLVAASVPAMMIWG